MRKRNSIATFASRIVVLTFASLLFAVALSGRSFGEEKSADELVALLNARINAEWEIPATIPEKVVACEQRGRKVMIFKSDADWNDPESVLWEWDPGVALPEAQAAWFNFIDECKPALGDSAVLVNASGGGAAMIRLKDKKLLFLGRPDGNTHSIALLPDGNVVTASSTGNFLALFVVATDAADRDEVEVTPVYKKYELVDAHGVVWDAKRATLWALGGNELLGFEYVGTKDAPELREIFRHELVGTQSGGHDLYPAPGYDALMTTGDGINVFDPVKRVFTTISETDNVKSISLAPDGSTLMLRAEENWWSDSVYFGDVNKTRVGQLDGARFYKARWFLPNAFSEPNDSNP
ncbi:MAG: DUF6528 family protein [Thermoguttaceae bacterium]|jgi:hypothetical protein